MSRLLTLQDDNGGFEFIGNAFKITGAVGDIDDLKKVFSISSELLSETTDVSRASAAEAPGVGFTLLGRRRSEDERALQWCLSIVVVAPWRDAVTVVKAEKDGDSMGLEVSLIFMIHLHQETRIHVRADKKVHVWYEDKEYEKAEKATAFNWWNVNPEKVPERRTTLWRAGKSHLQLGAPGGGRYTGPDRVGSSGGEARTSGGRGRAATASEKRDLAARQIQRALRRREQAKTGRCISVVALSGEVIYEAELREDLSIYQLKGEIANAKGLRRGQVQLSTDRKLEEHVKLKDVPEEDHRNLKPRPLVLTFTRVQDVSEIQSNATRRIAGAWFRHRRG
ncbi:Uncharacterized protein SCF082_LOCUS14902 [Durusdinium trenchii]|uniref:Uncharacterized protein n=1 Tax=Durusdinium trenchii TaxID=1381693 RepID=A0ABP0K171_9DINO